MAEPKREYLTHDRLRRLLEERARGQDVDLSLYAIEDFDFSGLDLHDVAWFKSALLHCRFEGADLSGGRFSQTQAPEGDFRRANLVKAEFYEADLSGAVFDGARLGRAFFNRCFLRGATFRRADLHDASFQGCDLTAAVFDEADLERVTFRHCRLEGVSWAGVKNFQAPPNG
jgi:uncharacterized protein YjbI with pentapeptide repeats